MVIDFEKLFEIKEFLWHLNIINYQYEKKALADNLSYKELTDLIYEDKFPETDLKPLDSFFKEAIKQTIITYCGLLKNEDKPLKSKTKNGLVKKIMEANLDCIGSTSPNKYL